MVEDGSYRPGRRLGGNSDSVTDSVRGVRGIHIIHVLVAFLTCSLERDDGSLLLSEQEYGGCGTGLGYASENPCRGGNRSARVLTRIAFDYTVMERNEAV